MIPKTTCSIYQGAFEETLNYFFDTDTIWLKTLIKSKEKLLDHPKIAHQRKILHHYSVQEDSLLNIFIVGEGNYGKSTLINAMIHGNIAPMNFLPTTWCIHRYMFGERKAICYFADQRILPLTIERAKAFVAEEENKSKTNKTYASDLVQIDWFYPEYPLLKKFTLVDTPGIAQLRSILSDSSIEEFYYKADCVLWLLDATRINSESTLTNMKQVSRYSKKIIGVINKWDIISANSKNNILRIAKETFGEFLTDLQPVSALFALKKNNTQNEKYKLSFIDELLTKIDGLFVHNAKRLSSVQIYNTLKQTIREALLILNNEIKDSKTNINLYLNNLLYIKTQGDLLNTLIMDRLSLLNQDFINNLESEISYQISFNSARQKLDEIEANSSHHYRNLISKSTEMRNQHYYQNIKYITEKKYISSKYNYDGTVNLLEKEDNLLDLDPIKAMNNMKISATVNIKLSSKLIEKFMSFLEEIPFFGKLIRESNERKKRELEQEIINQIRTQSGKNFNLMIADIKTQIEANYVAIERSYVNQFVNLFISMKDLKSMLEEAECKADQLDDKYLWATAIAQKLKHGELYAEVG